jgi:membrane-associated phospholipid phosphatase
MVSMRKIILLTAVAANVVLGQMVQDNDRDVSWKKLVPNILHDQVRIWTYPAHVVQGQNWEPAVAVTGITTGLAWGADPSSAHYFRNTSTFSGFNSVFTSSAMSWGIFAAPVSLYAAGLIRKDPKMSNTALLAGEAVADAEVVVEVLKPVFARARPSSLPPNSGFHDSWEAGSRFSASNNSFPSGHAIAAFSVATVIARRYGNHRWVPFAAYGGAALVAFSRLTLSAHYIADVFAGGALGYSISRFAVLPQQ